MKHTTAILIIISAASFAQGPLTPPGAPAPTMKTLDEIHTKVADVGERRTPISSLPFTISTGGSYYLTASLTSAGGDGITVTAGNVTIDLNGFTLAGAGSGKGISFSLADNVKIHNGVIRNWTTGILSDTSAATIVEKVLVTGCTGIGISQVSGGGCEVRDCTVRSNGSHGIRVNQQAVVVSNVVASNSGSGIRVEGTHGEVRGNSTKFNNIGVEILANRCLVHSNALFGDGVGIRVTGTGSSILRNSLRDHGTPFSIFAGNDAAPFEPASTSTNPHANISF